MTREPVTRSLQVALHRHSNSLIDILPPEADSSISLLADNEKPDVTFNVKPPTYSPTTRLLTHIIL